MSHTASNLIVHLVFSTKARQPLITSKIRNDVFAYLGGIVREMEGAALIVNGTADHVHMLVRVRPVQEIAEVVRVVKANSSRWARKVEDGFHLAERLWRFQRERIECAECFPVHRKSRGASQDTDLPGRICGVLEEK